MDNQHYQQVAVGALIFNSKKEILFVKRADDEEFLPGVWELPGGGSDYGETPQEAVVREIKEECGLHIKAKYPLSVHTYSMKDLEAEVQRIEITFLCELEGTETVVLSSEHSEYKWVTEKNIHTLELSDLMKKIITDTIQNPIVKTL